MKNDDFYIGWMQKAPGSIASFLRWSLLFLVLIVAIVAAVIAVKQKQFSTARFEFGTLTSLTGQYSAKPVPHLSIRENGRSVFVPLVGYGKHGVDGIIKNLEKERNQGLENKEVTLKGTLLYGDGKLLMQVDENDKPLIEVMNHSQQEEAAVELLGAVTLKGEVIDPKCYFGVMKPGEGKVHKDCAIRCISGGIPPVLKIKNEKGDNAYVLLVGRNGRKINDDVLDFVGIASEVSGELWKEEDWLVMQVSEMKNDLATYKKREQLSCIVSCCPTR